MEALLAPVLDRAIDLVDAVPQWALLVGHCAFCAGLANDLRDRFLLHYWVGHYWVGHYWAARGE